MTNIAAIIIGIEGWERYTLPLAQSIKRHEPKCDVIIVDNLSEPHYPSSGVSAIMIRPTNRLCYSAAINRAHDVLCEDYEGDTLVVSDHYDWYIVLSNDVICAGPFAHILETLPPCVAGPQLWHEHGLSWIVGWCVAIPREVWDAVGGWDEQYQVSSVEDVDFSTCAVEKGYPLVHRPDLPFVHLDQRQRFTLVPDYWQSEAHNWAHFRAKHGMVRA